MRCGSFFFNTVRCGADRVFLESYGAMRYRFVTGEIERCGAVRLNRNEPHRTLENNCSVNSLGNTRPRKCAPIRRNESRFLRFIDNKGSKNIRNKETNCETICVGIRLRSAFSRVLARACHRPMVRAEPGRADVKLVIGRAGPGRVF